MLLPLFQPDGVDAVGGAVDVATEHALVRLDEAGLRLADEAAGGAREAPVAPEGAREERIAYRRLDELQAGSRPGPRVQRHRDVALEQCFERGLGDALDRAVGMESLPDDCEAHRRTP